MYAALAVLGLAASSAVAAPTRSRLAERIARRAARNGQTIQRIGFSDHTEASSTSTNWAGAAFDSSYSAQYNGVFGTFTVPTPKVPSGGSSSQTYSASAWVGIDGDSCQSALWQTGLDFTVQGTSVSYDSWYEWIPAGAVDFSGISFSAGDTVSLSVTASSKTTGTATITNESTGKTVTKDMTGTSDLCFENAEWIVEDFEEGGGLVPLANWGTVTFTNATAQTVSGSTVGPSGADTINLSHGGKIVSSTTIGDNSVTVAYTA